MGVGIILFNIHALECAVFSTTSHFLGVSDHLS